MKTVLNSIFITIFINCLCTQAGLAREASFKIHPCKLDDPQFKEIMDEIKKDHEYRKISIDEKVENKRLNRRDPDQSNIIMEHRDWEIKDNFDSTIEQKTITYYGSPVDHGDPYEDISFDTKSSYKIFDVTACTIYFKDNQWLAKTPSVISEPVPEDLSTEDLFSSSKSVKIMFPSDSYRIYTVLMFKQKKSLPSIPGYPKGFNVYVQTPYSTKIPGYNYQYSFTLPLDMKHSAELKTKGKIRSFGVAKLMEGKNNVKYVLTLNKSIIISDSDISIEDYMLPYFVISTFDSWESSFRGLADIYEQKLHDGETFINSELEEIAKAFDKKVKELTDSHIYCYLSNFYSWENYHKETGGGFIPHNIKDIIYNHKGDCKDIALLFTGLLRAAGYKASPVIIRTNNMWNYDLDTPVNIFNHAITGYYDKDGRYKILDASSHNNILYTGLPDFISNRNYITWDYDENNVFSIKKGRTPTLDQSANVYRNISFDLSDKSHLNCKVQFENNCCDAWAGDLDRAINAKATESDKKTAIRKFIFGNSESFSYKILERSFNYISVAGTGVLDEPDDIKYIENAGNEQILIKQKTPRIISKDDADDRYTDFVLSNRITYYDATFIYNVPDGYTVESIPDPSTFFYGDDYITFKADFKVVGNTVEYNYLVSYNKTIIPRDDCEKEAEKMEAIKKYTHKYIILKKIASK
ncbi:MAG: transglutaminase domain-containing protein [bacterium]